MLDYTPMPGEKFEDIAEREKATAESEAIANGENFNPNLTPESIQAFENLADTVPFAGDQEQENPAEEPKQETDRKYDSSNPITQKFNESWNEGQTPNLDNIQESVERDYMEGAVEQSTNTQEAKADISETEHNSADSSDITAPSIGDQTHDLAEAAAMQAVSAAALSEDIVDKVAAGDEQAISKIEEVKERAAKAQSFAENLNTTLINNSEDSTESNMATSVANQAIEKAAKAVDAVEQANAEQASMSNEEKEIAQTAVEAAEENGTTVEEEKEKLSDATPDQKDEPVNWAKGIFG